ncbi:hypothetical protein [Streptomyces sp. NPDC049906]|uniref:hypothetical protein n=1 Tax=Streptomyces sp. NPDC049906 TaxID=3155656 RepID=UPI00344129B6
MVRTLFRYLLDEREWRTHGAFLAAFAPVAHQLGLTGIEPASTTFEAWYYGKRRPQRDARRVLVEMLGYSIDQLWAEVPEEAHGVLVVGASATVEAEVLLGRGDDRLSAEAARAVREFSDSGSVHWAFGDLAGAQCNHALTHLYAGELEGAAAAIRPVLDLPVNQRNNGIVVSAARVRRALSKGTLGDAAVARELREEIAQYGSGRLALPRG